MSYSRWSESKWYSYWDVASGETLDEQVFTVCGEAQFTYRELKDDLPGCLRLIDGDEELVRYIQQWFADVEAEFAPGKAK